MKLLIKNGHVVDPANKINGKADILIDRGRIVDLGPNLKTAGAKIIDAVGKIVMPGLVDMHVHLRQPGREDKETVKTATLAAARGGVTTLLSMPNTTPAIDCAENVRLLQAIIKKDACVDVLIAASITIAREGKQLTDIAQLKKEGVLAITDDGSSVDNSELMLEALKQAQANKLLVIAHCEDKSLSKDGVVNLGIIATRMGLRGISRESEYKRIERDIALAKKAKAKLHIAHVSCRESVEIVRQAKKQGLAISCETAPHYIALTDKDVVMFDPNRKINPPLRSAQDQKALLQGLKSSTIEVIASDHAPHTENEKDIEFDRAEFGTIGLETELAVAITELVHKKILNWSQLVQVLSLNPAKILGINKGSLSIGAAADVIIVDPGKEWTVSKEGIVSKSKNSAFLGRKLKGVVEYTIYQGQIIYPAQAQEKKI